MRGHGGPPRTSFLNLRADGSGSRRSPWISSIAFVEGAFMRRSIGKRLGFSRSKGTSLPIMSEQLEPRMLLTATLGANWTESFLGPSGAGSGGDGDDPYVESTTDTNSSGSDSHSGDIFMVSAGQSSVSGDSDKYIFVAAFKPNGSGGWELDTSFGDTGNDSTHVSPLPGYAVIDMSILGQPAGLSTGIAIDANGNVDVSAYSSTSGTLVL